jgi:predicted DNA-binding transcriptional regulator AlpA
MSKLIPDAQVCARYGVTVMTLWRWDRDASLSFPKPVYIRKRKYRDVSELDAFDAAQRSVEPPVITPPRPREAA